MYDPSKHNFYDAESDVRTVKCGCSVNKDLEIIDSRVSKYLYSEQWKVSILIQWCAFSIILHSLPDGVETYI